MLVAPSCFMSKAISYVRPIIFVVPVSAMALQPQLHTERPGVFTLAKKLKS